MTQPVPTHTATLIPTGTPLPTATAVRVPPAPTTTGKAILVDLSRQQLWAYEDGALAFTFTVESGRPQLPTPTGEFHIYEKTCSDKQWMSETAPTALHNESCVQHVGDNFPVVFYSLWAPGSPFYSPPYHVNYALKFRDIGFYLHDAWWHTDFGPGSNVPHQLPDGSTETGTHGCVGMRTADAATLYAWTPLGTALFIRANDQA